MKKKFIKIMLTIALGATVLIPTIKASAVVKWNQGSNQDQIISVANKLTDRALSNQTFTNFNIAYRTVMDIENQDSREALLDRLVPVASKVYTPDVLKICKHLEVLINTPNGRIYNEIEAEIRASSLQGFDKDYLLGELTSWGRKLVFTEDYKAASDKVIEAWNRYSEYKKNPVADTLSQTREAIIEADKVINAVANEESKAYLKGETKKLKGLTATTENTIATWVAYSDLAGTMTIEQKKTYLDDLLTNDKNIKNIPQDYFSTDAGLKFTEVFSTRKLPKNAQTLTYLQGAVNEALAAVESSKTAIPTETVTIAANTSGTDIDITDKLITSKEILNQGAKYGASICYMTEINKEYDNGYLYEVNGRVYLKSKSVSKGSVKTRVHAYFSYANTYKSIGEIEVVIK